MLCNSFQTFEEDVPFNLGYDASFGCWEEGILLLLCTLEAGMVGANLEWR
jgi:hypothetical protein